MTTRRRRYRARVRVLPRPTGRPCTTEGAFSLPRLPSQLEQLHSYLTQLNPIPPPNFHLIHSIALTLTRTQLYIVPQHQFHCIQ